MSLDDTLQRYMDTFGETFPTFYFRGRTAAMISELEKALKANQPYKLPNTDNILY